VLALLLLPLVFLALQAVQVGWSALEALLVRRLTAVLLWNTVRLTAVVTAGSAVIGVALAWLTERTTLPGRRVWAALVVLPIAVPDFVLAWGWASLFPSLQGLTGAAFVLTLGLYPLVYLPVAAGFRGADPAQEEVARSLGFGPVRTFWAVTLRQAQLALLGGCALVALYLLAEYGAFSILRYQTFTTEIFTEFKVGFNTPMAAALSLVVVLLGLLIVSGEGAAARIVRLTRPQPRARAVPRVRLGAAAAPVAAALALLVAAAVGVPLGAIVYWLLARQPASVAGAVPLADAAWHTAAYSASAAAVTTLLALPAAILTVRRRGPLVAAVERAGLLEQAVPGLVVALALVFFAVRYAQFAYQTAVLLVTAYTIMFFPRALVAMQASVARVPPALEEVARSLGHRPAAAVVRVTLPLIVPGVLAAFFLAFLTGVTELTATLVLIPTGVETLATQFWAYSTDLAYGAAAPYAAAMLIVSVVPIYLLGRWFDRIAAAAPQTGTST
jgi:iron(III) transport system permease protein